MDGRSSFEVIIVGAGIAGASLAYFLTERGMSDVLVVEREWQPAYHASGRSAATVVELDPIETVQRLKVLSAGFLRSPPAGFSERPLLDPCGVLICLRAPAWQVLAGTVPSLELAGIRLDLLSPREIAARVPVLSAKRFAGAVHLPEDGHVDVHELLSSYLRQARRRGADLRCDVEVRGMRALGKRLWEVVTTAGVLRSRWVVNAGGAWAGTVGAEAGASAIPVQPYRRTIVTFGAPDGIDVGGWPLVISESDSLYFVPASGGLLLSPMDEEPMAPCDARPDDVVVAAAMERLGVLAPRLAPRSLRRRWAGLRTFAPDRVPVIGEDPRMPGFFWLAGQGGAGIETSPGIGQIAADLIVDGHTDRFAAEALAPSRFAA